MATRRNLLGGAALAGAGLAYGRHLAHADTAPLSPIMAAARELAVLDKLHTEGEAAGHNCDHMSAQELEIAETIYGSTPQCVGDAAILLMAAAADISRDELCSDGTMTRELGEVVVRRVMHFLATTAGIDLLDYGGTYQLPVSYQPPLAGTVAEAAKRLHGVDKAEAQRRRDEAGEREHLLVLRAKNTPETERMVAEMVNRAVERFDARFAS